MDNTRAQTPRGPDRFIDGVPTAYRFLKFSELDGMPSGQVANFVADAEFHLHYFQDQQPMLIIGAGDYPNPTLAEMAEGLRFFEVVFQRPTWLKVYYFSGTDMVSLEPPFRPL